MSEERRYVPVVVVVEKKACAKRSQDEDRTRNLILPCEIKNVGGDVGTTVYNWDIRMQ